MHIDVCADSFACVSVLLAVHCLAQLEGDQTLDKLADLTGYEGSRDFDVAPSAAADVAAQQ